MTPIERHEQEAILRDLLEHSFWKMGDNYPPARAERIMTEMQRMKVQIVRCGDE